MSWCNYYYRIDTGELLEDDYKSIASLDNCLSCAIKWDKYYKKIEKIVLDKDDEFYKKYYCYGSWNMSYHTTRKNEKDKVLLNIMDKYNIDELVIDVN